MRLSDSSDPEATDSASDLWESFSLVAAPVEKDRETFFLDVAPVEKDRLPVCFAVFACMPTSSSATIRDCAKFRKIRGVFWIAFSFVETEILAIECWTNTLLKNLRELVQKGLDGFAWLSTLHVA